MPLAFQVHVAITRRANRAATVDVELVSIQQAVGAVSVSRAGRAVGPAAVNSQLFAIQQAVLAARARPRSRARHSPRRSRCRSASHLRTAHRSRCRYLPRNRSRSRPGSNCPLKTNFARGTGAATVHPLLTKDLVPHAVFTGVTGLSKSGRRSPRVPHRCSGSHQSSWGR